MNRPRVYISGPITLGDREQNFMQFCNAHRYLMRHGFAVNNPGLTMKLPGCWDIAHDDWLENDLPWVEVADAVLRLPGYSEGADEEVWFSRHHDVPVFFSISDLESHFFDEEDLA